MYREAKYRALCSRSQLSINTVDELELFCNRLYALYVAVYAPIYRLNCSLTFLLVLFHGFDICM